MNRIFKIGTILAMSLLILVTMVLPDVVAQNNDSAIDISIIATIPELEQTNDMLLPPDVSLPPPIDIPPPIIKFPPIKPPPIIIPPPKEIPPPIEILPSNIKIQVSPKEAVNSRVNIFMGSNTLGYVTGGAKAQTFPFANGGDYKIEAIAEKGYIFDKICDTGNKCVTKNTITGYINPTGDYLTYIGYFKPDTSISTPPIASCDPSYPDFCMRHHLLI